MFAWGVLQGLVPKTEWSSPPKQCNNLSEMFCLRYCVLIMTLKKKKKKRVKVILVHLLGINGSGLALTSLTANQASVLMSKVLNFVEFA